MSTSGDAEQYVTLDGVRYSHIVDPRTGMALTGPAAVTVIAPNGLTSDVLATAVSVMGPADGLALVEAAPGAAAWIAREGSDGIERFVSRRWPTGHSNPAHGAARRVAAGARGECCG